MAQVGTEQLHPGDQHEIPNFEAHESPESLKGRVKKHYEIASDYYYSLWGQHIHHGLFRSASETKEQAQVNLINYLLEISGLPTGSKVLDVGCGIGGTSRFLAREHGAQVTGITISGRQVQIAKQLTSKEISDSFAVPPGDFFNYLGKEGKPSGTVRFLELDAEKMLEHFQPTVKEGESFDCVWISEALSHLPNKDLFFSSSFSLLRGGGSRLVIADWFKAPGLSPEQEEADIKPIEDGMLLPRLYTADEYVEFAKRAGFKIRQKPIDISKEVAKTWDISWSLVSSPSLWAFAISQGRDGLSFLQAFRAMRRGYANGTFRYAVMCFEKP
ncbi:S-adenosyl-L-methionine-dependent methyltransferase [Annulohypoxylon truncatum]|uniref:S-adenosyl-L-methionine-dependent methyltransferase n=1 Tax=Annulohypoxylon truncatum TaxID=327061 RepID=UPI0020077E98|nr:S-adenosyl-L-methionine-dependent methyltransferase [Annulohypoxylon truncatum]KAI1215064.1 S-adenosyl-L-methionine-dependent methyltransferase [Annulohypoxylon truncatum]